VCVSTVGVVLGNLSHFTVNSGARIGAHPWKLPERQYIDLRVERCSELSDEDLLPLTNLWWRRGWGQFG